MTNFFSDFYIYLNFFMNLFILVNPIGIIPIFSNMTKNQSLSEKYKTNFLTNITVFIILSIVMFLGNKILHFLSISMSSFRIAGGILIIGIAFTMMNEKFINSNKNNCQKPKNVAIIPLAIPLIAGPGTISSTIIWSEQYSSFINHLGGIFIIGIFNIFCWILFTMEPCITAIFGTSSLKIMTKIMSLLLMSMGVELITYGIREIILNV